MKKIILLFQLLLATMVVQGQVIGSNNLEVTGYVSTAGTGQPVNNHPIYLNSLNAPTVSMITTTDANGRYAFTVFNGSLIGPNRIFELSTPDCESTLQRDTIENMQGTRDSIYAPFTLCQGAATCTALFTVVPSPNGGMSYYFLSALADSSYNYRWTINGTAFAETVNGHHTFTEPGTYTVCLRVQRGEPGGITSCVDEFCREVVVESNTGTQYCNAQFEFLTTPGGNIRVRPVAPYSPNFTYTWTAANGANFQNYDPILPFFEGENNYVCLSVSDNGQCYVSFCDSLFIPNSNQACNASFEYTVQTTNGGAPYVINCYAIQSDTINYQHDWQFGGSIPYLGNSISYSVENAGIYTVCHTLANSQTGCLDTICKVITVVPDTATFLCVADFNYSVSSTNILRMLFNNESLPNAGTNYVWSFGDNTTGNQPNPEHTFPSSGIYNVCVTMTNGTCTDTRCMEVAVGQLPNDCEAAFTFSPSMNNPLRILFTNQSTSGDSANYYWNFEGGSSAFSFNAERTFPVAGIYEVCLYTYSANCQDSICKQVSVGQPGGDCSAEFVINGFASASPATLQFIPSTNQQGTHEWFFSNGIVVNGVSPTLIFSDTGNYNVCHVFTSTQSNCTDTICKEFTVGPNAGGGFTIAGQVFAGANYADWARVKLLRFDPVSLAAIVVSETYTDSGYYSFPGIEAGIYLVKAALLENSNYYSNYVPTYFGSQYYWFNAEPINLLSNGWSYNISLIYASNPGGPGTIGGNINDDPFRISAGGVNPVSNADIIITSTQDEPQRWTVSDLNGEFNVSNLAYGTYRLFADLAGQICIPVEFTLSEDVPSVNIALSLGDGITGIVEPVFATLQGELFPNPTSRSSQLSLNLKETERLRFKLLDVTGKSIWENTQLLNPGKQTITIPVDGIGSGIYILSVIGEDNRVVGSRKLTVIP